MSRPTDLPDFATGTNYAAGPYVGQPNKAKPPAGIITEGFDPQAPLPAEWVNWALNNHAAWIDCFDSIATFTPPSTSLTTPQVTFKDSAGNVRSVVDHNGYPMGRRFDIREDWVYNTGTISATAAPIASAPRWSASILTGTITPQAPSSTYPAPFLQINSPGGGSSTRAVIYSSNQIVNTGFANLSMVVEWEAGSSGGGDTTHVVQNFMGLSDTFGPPVVNNGNYILFRNLSNATSLNWLADTCSSGTATSVDTGVAVPNNSTPANRFRIEVYGSGSPYGSKVRFFINESLVATTTTNIPATAMYLVFAATSALGGNPITIWLGGLQVAFNRALSVAGL